MNLELNDVGMTFLVGAFVLLAIEAVSYFIFGRHLIRFFEGQLGLTPSNNTPPAITTGVFIGVSFALGLLVEDVCHKYDDANIDWPFRFAYGTLHIGADSHADSNLKASLQHSVLIEKLKQRNPELTGLGYAVFSSGIFETVLGRERGTAITNWALRSNDLPKGSATNRYEGLRRGIAAVFYFDKNRVYFNENYFGEMSRIQARIDFSRTIATSSLVGTAASAIVAVIALAAARRNRKQFRTKAFRTALVVACFAATYVLSYHAYIRESKEFNKRVFGYYDSMLVAARTGPTPTALP